MIDSRSRRYDVVVIGGGAAGIGAALGARQCGARTLLVERYGFVGGAATNASVLSYCGFYVSSDERRQVVGGAGAKVLAELARLGLDVVPVRAPSGNWIVMLDPEGLKHALDRIVARHAVDVRLHCTLTGARTSDARIGAVTLFDHAGPFEVEAAAFVDASGDADLGCAAGVPSMRDADPQRTRQLASFPVRVGGVPPELEIDRGELARLMQDFGANDGRARVRRSGGHFLRLPRGGDRWWFGIDVETGGLDSADLAEAERDARDAAWRFVEYLRARMRGLEHAYLAASGPRLGIRDSRQLVTRYRLSDDDVLSGRTRGDGIACGCWPAELHSATYGQTFHAIGGEGYYHVPLAAVRASAIDNLWVGGRAIGCEPAAYGSARVMGTAFATGQAAGVAAARAASGASPDDAEAVRKELLRQGAIL